jgi:hypothetical protein
MIEESDDTLYSLAHCCKHEPPLRLMLNGEFACDRCLHVAMRRDGSVPIYRAHVPPPGSPSSWPDEDSNVTA